MPSDADLIRHLLDSTRGALVLVDRDGRITHLNHRAEEMFGYGAGVAAGEEVEVLLPERIRRRHRSLLLSYLREPSVRHLSGGHLIGRRRDGAEFPVEITLTPIGSGDDVIIAVSVVDPTELSGEAAVVYAAIHDPLTGLANRSLLMDRLEQALARASRNRDAVAVLFLDLDQFKMVNDTRGHSVGDQLLKVVADRLRTTVRAHDTLARFGGDEFVVMAEGFSSADEPEVLARRLAEAFDEPFTLDETVLSVKASIGVATGGFGDRAETLIRDADTAMYRAKDHIHGPYVIFEDEMRAGLSQRVEVEAALRRGLERYELDVHYQPVIDLTDGAVTGVEALARWNHPSRGLLAPDEFIPVAEDTGLIVPLGMMVLAMACRDAVEWGHDHPGHPQLSVAVNISAQQLVRPEFVAGVHEILVHSQLAPDQLCLELTESRLLSAVGPGLPTLRGLKDLGVRFAVDDFGTGYSPLTYLRTLPVDILKIDKSFVAGFSAQGDVAGDRAIVRSVIDLANAFGLTTIAEGVETETQLGALNALGCAQAQGYYWSRPVPFRDLVAWMDGSGRLRLPTGERLAAGDDGMPGPVDRLSVLLVDDDARLRAVLSGVLEAEANCVIVGDAADGREAVVLARRHHPDLIVLDLAMPGMGGLESLPLLRAVAPNAWIIVITALDSEDLWHQARRLGADDFWMKGTSFDLLLDMIRRAGPRP